MHQTKSMSCCKGLKTNANKKIKYWIFDIAVTIVLAVYSKSLCKSLFAKYLPSKQLYTNESINGDEQTIAASNCDANPNNRSGMLGQMFDIGDIVEVYDSDFQMLYSFPAVVTDVRISDEGLVNYDIISKFDESKTLKNVYSSNVRSIEPYGRHTDAVCNLARLRSTRMVPCTVVMHHPESDGGYDGSYTVSFRTMKNIEYTTLPVFKVQKIMKTHPTPSDSTQFDQSPSLSNSYSPLSSPTVSNEMKHFEAGSIVEVYNPQGGSNSFPATIIGVSNVKGSSIMYGVVNSVTKSLLENIDQYFIRPYEAYEAGTQASCFVGTEEIKMVPCEIVSHWKELNNEVSYEVSLFSHTSKQSMYLPYSKVNRLTNLEK